MAISSDSEFKAALNDLSRAGQRLLAARFVEHVLDLSQDARLKAVVAAAKRSDITEDELAAALHSAQAARVDSYTQCGHECDWNSQAGHFVAQAALDCLKEQGNAAWDTAMHARMARTCKSVAGGDGTDNDEAEAQYRIVTEFMNA